MVPSFELADHSGWLRLGFAPKLEHGLFQPTRRACVQR